MKVARMMRDKTNIPIAILIGNLFIMQAMPASLLTGGLIDAHNQ
jgi:hypothetical protein